MNRLDGVLLGELTKESFENMQRLWIGGLNMENLMNKEKMRIREKGQVFFTSDTH
jgi:hypothetical protein